MKCLTLLTLFLSLNGFAQTIDPGAMGGSVGALNQVTKETDQEGLMNNQQDQQEQNYQEEKQRENEEWEASKAQDRYRFDEPEKSKKWKSQ
jgi:Sec-independent protein translocase protein TatA